MRRFALLLCLLMCIGSTALAEPSLEDWYLEISEDMAAKLGILVGDEAFQEMYLSAPSELMDCIDALEKVDFDVVSGAYRCEMPSGSVMKLLAGLIGDGETDEMSDFGWERLEMQLPQMIVTTYNGKQGAVVLAAAGVLTFSRTFIMPEGFENCLMLVEMPGGMAAIGFSKTGDETVTATIQPLFAPEENTAEKTVKEIVTTVIPLKAEKVR